MYIVNTLFKSRQMFSPCLFVYFLQYVTCILNGPSSTVIYHLFLPQKKINNLCNFFYIVLSMFVINMYIQASCTQRTRILYMSIIKTKPTLNLSYNLSIVERVSEWLFNANSANFQLYHGEWVIEWLLFDVLRIGRK